MSYRKMGNELIVLTKGPLINFPCLMTVPGKKWEYIYRKDPAVQKCGSVFLLVAHMQHVQRHVWRKHPKSWVVLRRWAEGRIWAADWRLSTGSGRGRAKACLILGAHSTSLLPQCPLNDVKSFEQQFLVPSRDTLGRLLHPHLSMLYHSAVMFWWLCAGGCHKYPESLI